jgi:hypothetical protein
MPLDPQAQKVVDALAALNLKPFKDSTPAEARESMRSRTAALGPFEEVAAVTDHRVPGGRSPFASTSRRAWARTRCWSSITEAAG